MQEEINEEFNRRFATVEDALKYIADSQAKSEFIRKRDNAELRQKLDEIAVLQRKTQQQQEKTQQQLERTQKHLDHITKILRFNIEEHEFQEEKLVEAGKTLGRRQEVNL